MGPFSKSSVAYEMQISVFFFQAEDGIRDTSVTGVQTCALPIWLEEPLVVDRIDLAALVDRGHGAVDHFLERRIVAPQHDPVRLDRQRVGGDDEVRRVLGAGDERVEEIGRASCRERGEMSEDAG